MRTASDRSPATAVMVTTTLAADSDWYDQEITLKSAEGFHLGDGICLRAKNPATNASVVLKRTLVARSGPRISVQFRPANVF